jgi:hypothetical protein
VPGRELYVSIEGQDYLLLNILANRPNRPGFSSFGVDRTPSRTRQDRRVMESVSYSMTSQYLFRGLCSERSFYMFRTFKTEHNNGYINATFLGLQKQLYLFIDAKR